MKLDGKNCLITGGTSGLGAATAHEFLRKGANVVVAGRSATGHEKTLDDLNQSASLAGRKLKLVCADFGSSEDCRRAVSEAERETGPLDVLVHAAGGAVPGNLADVSEDAWMKAFDVHVHAVFHLAKAVVPGMKQRRDGAIILIGSTAGLRGCLGALAYGVVKGALPQFARALARELADSNVRVNCISPGVIRTPFQVILTPEQAKNNIDNRIPLHREGRPEDVAAAVAMVVENDYITGENLTIDGGLTMRIA